MGTPASKSSTEKVATIDADGADDDDNHDDDDADDGAGGGDVDAADYPRPVYTSQFTALVDGKSHDSDPPRGLRSLIQVFSDAVQSGGVLVRI